MSAFRTVDSRLPRKSNPNFMKRNAMIFGLVLGTILCTNMVFMVNLMYTSPDFKGNDVLGYAAMLVIFSLIFFGVRNFRNKDLGGYISFGKAFATGFWIALLASTMYVVIWLFYYYLFVPDFMEVYTDYVLKQCAADELESKTVEMENMNAMYKNPLLVVLITYSEVLPMGLLVALVSALVLKRKPKSEISA